MSTKITNLLLSQKVNYKIHEHAKLASVIKSPTDFAKALGYPIGRITKSLFLRSINGDKYAIAVCSIDKNIDFSIIAGMMDCKKVEVAKKDELQEKIGYPPNGVSPIGIESYPIFMDQGLLDYDTVLLGAGKVGVEVEMSPFDLKLITNAIVLRFVINK